jgi:hypothetical protein
LAFAQLRVCFDLLTQPRWFVGVSEVAATLIFDVRPDDATTRRRRHVMTFHVRRALYGRHRQRRADSAQRGQAQDLQPDRDTCGGVLERMARTQTLWAAWARVAAGSGMPGADGITVQDFAARLGPRLDRLAEQLAARQYEPQPLRLAAIHRGGRRRRLGLPTVRDRIGGGVFLTRKSRGVRGGRR